MLRATCVLPSIARLLPSCGVALALLATPSAALAQQGGEIRIRVVDAQGQAVTQAQVRIRGTDFASRLEDNGEARFRDVPAGDYVIEVTTETGGRGIEAVSVGVGEAVEVTITVSAAIGVADIVVSLAAELYTPRDVLRGADLTARTEASLGETLAGRPGVSSSYHGAGASRPIIRGLGGSRIRVLESGVGSGDASTTSPDHAPGVEAATADRIEVIRGPATLLYGGAIGGVVNIEDGRVPQRLPGSSATGSVTLRGGTVGRERNVGGRFDGAVGNVAYHMSGLYRNTGDFRVPHDGILPNTSITSSRVAVGLSHIGSRGFVGVSFSGLGNDYGVPGEHHHHGEGDDHEEEEDDHGEEDDHEEEDGNIRIDLRQRRADLMAGRDLGDGFFNSVNLRFGLADYQHSELLLHDDGDQDVEARFFNNEWEGRLEVRHQFARPGSGAFGIQARHRNFQALGEGQEVLIAPATTTTFAAFVFEEMRFGRAGLQAGARIESQRTSAEGFPARRSFLNMSGSVGAEFNVAGDMSLFLSGARAERAPTSDELFTSGQHLALLANEFGNPNLSSEVAYTVDAGVRLEGPIRGELSFFVNSFDSFIYRAISDAPDGGLRELRWRQAPAVFRGFEVQASTEIFHIGDGHLVLDAWGDYVRAELSDDNEPLPQIPPLSLGTGLGWSSPTWRGRASVRRIGAQNRIAPLETATDSYTMLDANVGYRLVQGAVLHDITLYGKNLTDQEARNHTSLIKEFVPLPGREIRLIYQLTF